MGAPRTAGRLVLDSSFLIRHSWRGGPFRLSMRRESLRMLLRRSSPDQGVRGSTGGRSQLMTVSSNSLLAREFPGFGVFPGDVDSVVEVQQEAFAAVEEAEAKEIVVDERCQRAQDDVDRAEADFAVGFRDDHLCAQR